MIRLSVFKLSSVIRYSQEDLLDLLAQSITKITEQSVELDPALSRENVETILEQWASETSPKGLSLEQRSEVRKQFHKNLKKLYLDNEEAFEVRPGVQSIFSHLEKEKRWKYGIISPLWSENTKFILQSCGVFSKTKLTLSVDDANSELGQIDILSERGQKKEHLPEIEIICTRKAGRFKKEGYRVLKPKASNKEQNYFVYPRFSEFFKLKAKKKEKGKKSKP